MIISDAWLPQVNGVVRTLSTIADELRQMGHTVEVVGPDRFPTLPLPTYPDIRISLFPRRRLGRIIEDFAPDALHLATGELRGAIAQLVLDPQQARDLTHGRLNLGLGHPMCR
jgi:hypothetical protein